MKTHVIYINIIIVLLILGLLAFYMWDKARQGNAQWEQIVQAQEDTVVHYRNSYGHMVAERDAAMGSLNQLKMAYPGMIAKVEKELGIKAKNMVTALEAEFRAKGMGKVIIRRDTVKMQADRYYVQDALVNIDDGYLKLDGTIKLDSWDSLKYTYSYSDTLITAFEVKKSLFKKDRIRVISVLSNPNAKIVQTTGVVVHEVKPKRFVVSVGVHYDPIRNTFGPSVQAGYAFLRF